MQIFERGNFHQLLYFFSNRKKSKFKISGQAILGNLSSGGKCFEID
jgi:hypothetical protein